MKSTKTRLIAGLLGLMAVVSACESDLEVTKASPPAEVQLVSPDFNFLVRNPGKDSLLLTDTLQVEFYLRQLDAQQIKSAYKFSFSVSGGDGDFWMGPDTLRQNDISSAIVYNNLLPTKYRVLGKFVPYRPRKGGASTFTFTCRDGDNRTKQATLVVYYKDK